MGTFPPTVAPQGAGPSGPSPAPPGRGAAPGGAPGGGSPLLMLANLGTIISGLSKQFPAADEGIKMMLDGLRMVQASVQAQSVPQQSAAPPL